MYTTNWFINLYTALFENIRLCFWELMESVTTLNPPALDEIGTKKLV